MTLVLMCKVCFLLPHLNTSHVVSNIMSIIGDVRLFDFGLAKEYDPSKADKNGCYKMTGCTGSTRYMAPEVALNKPCNETIDVYSFGILFYQILALEAPFEGLTVKSFPKLVFEKGARPVPDPKWPVEISALMKQCWSPKISVRPSMAVVSDSLAREITRNEKALVSNKPEVRRVGGRNQKTRIVAVTKELKETCVSSTEQYSNDFAC